MDDHDWFYSRPPESDPTSFSPHALPSDGRRQAIIEASYRLLVEKGFAGFRVRDAAERGDQGWHGYLALMLRDGVRAGHFRQDLNPAAAAWAVLSFIKGLGVTMPDADMAAAIHELETWLGG